MQIHPRFDPTPLVRQRLPLSAAPRLRGRLLPVTMYDAGEVRLTLECLPSMRHSGKKALYGVVLFLDGSLTHGERAVVQLLVNGDVAREGAITSLGGFMLDDISAGSYRLTVRLPSMFMVIEQLYIE